MKSKNLFFIVVPVFWLSACIASAQQQGRYIVYLKKEVAERLASPDAQSAQLKQWGESLQGGVTLERQLATGGWVLTVSSPDNAAEQKKAVERLPEVDTVDVDAMLRHQ